MKTYTINTYGKHLLEQQRSEVFKMIIGGILFFIALFFGIRFTIEEKIAQVFLILCLTLIYIIIFVIIPIDLRKKVKNIVKEISINGESVILHHSKSKITISKEKLLFTKVKNKFTGFGNNNNNGILIKIIENKNEFWIVSTFYNDYEDLEKLLLP